MSKKFVWTLLICLVLFFVGVYIFSHLRRTPPPNTNPASNWPVLPPPAATNPSAPAGRNAKEPAARGAEAKKESAPTEPAFALRSGETLQYDANIAKLNSTVANLKIVAAEKRNLGGKGSWHLQAFAHTENPYRMVFELDDEFDSYSDAGNMTSLQYEMHLNERGQKVDNVERLLSSSGDPTPAGTSAARVLPGTRDPLGMLEYLRGVDWNHVTEVHSPVYDGRKLYNVHAALRGKSSGVTVPAGKYNTIRIEIHVMDNGAEMKDAHFVLYLTDDAARLPVLMEAVLPVATARVELTKMK